MGTMKNMDGNEPQVQFEEQQTPSSPASQSPQSPLLTWIIRYSGGLIQNTRQATYAALSFIVTAAAASILLFSQLGTDIPPEALENPEYGLPMPD